METQAQAPGQPQAQEPVHPIHEQEATLNKLTEWVRNTPDNDPHAGTDLEEQSEAKPEQPEPEQPTEPAALEIDETAELFEVPDLADKTKKVKVSLKTLTEERMMKADYMRSIQKVKAQEADLQKQVQEASNKAAQEYIQKLEAQKQAISKLAGVKTMAEIEALSREDPAGAQQEFLRFISVNQTLQGIEQEQSQAAQKLQAEKQSQRQQTIRQTWETLTSDIPDWSQDKYNNVLKSSLDDYGFDAREVIDAGLIKALHDASEFRKLQKAKPEIEKRVVAVPKVLKPGSAEKPNPEQEQTTRARERLKKSGNVRDAAMAYLARQK